MARGFAFEIQADPINLHSFGESDIYDWVPEWSDYVEDLNAERAEEERNDLISAFNAAGAETGEDIIVNCNGETVTAPYVIFSDDAKRQYYSERYKAFKKAAAEITEDAFAGVNTLLDDAVQYSMQLYRMSHALKDTYGDCVYQNNYLMTLDDFIRNAKAGKKVYIGNVVFMH